VVLVGVQVFVVVGVLVVVGRGVPVGVTVGFGVPVRVTVLVGVCVGVNDLLIDGVNVFVGVCEGAMYLYILTKENKDPPLSPLPEKVIELNGSVDIKLNLAPTFVLLELFDIVFWEIFTPQLQYVEWVIVPPVLVENVIVLLLSDPIAISIPLREKSKLRVYENEPNDNVGTCFAPNHLICPVWFMLIPVSKQEAWDPLNCEINPELDSDIEIWSFIEGTFIPVELQFGVLVGVDTGVPLLVFVGVQVIVLVIVRVRVGVGVGVRVRVGLIGGVLVFVGAGVAVGVELAVTVLDGVTELVGLDVVVGVDDADLVGHI